MVIRRLRLRPRPDNVANDVRRRGVVWSRIVYLSILAATALWLLDLMFGSYIYLASEGMVVGPQATVATEFPATVRTISVREGDRVVAGQPIATISSQHVTENIARLTAELARLRMQESDQRVQIERSLALIRLATSRSDIASDVRRRYESLENRGLLPSDKKLSAVDAEYRSHADVAVLKAEVSTLQGQLERITPAINEVEAALRELQRLYRQGEVRAPIDGIVGRRHVDAGAVVTAGMPLVDIVGHDTYVLAYLPSGTLYSVEPGRAVAVEWGVRRSRGRVTAIDPVAAALPREFQTAFKPQARHQVLRIELDPPNGESRKNTAAPPLFTKVEIRSVRMGSPFGWFL